MKKYRIVTDIVCNFDSKMTLKLEDDTFKARLGSFITQIQYNVTTKEAPGVYIVIINDTYCTISNIFEDEQVSATVSFIEEAKIETEKQIAKMYNCNSIYSHLQSRKERLHTIIMSYSCKDFISGAHILSLSGPI